jgi:hypothetical protein
MQKNRSCLRLDLNSGFTTNVSVKSYTIMVPMVPSLLRSFWCGCEGKQKINPSPVLAPQNQNACAVRAIQCIMYMAQTFMVYASLHWTEQNSDDIYLCPFAVVKHLGWVYNRVPNLRSGINPLAVITRERSDYGPPPPSCVRMSCVHPWSQTTDWPETP